MEPTREKGDNRLLTGMRRELSEVPELARLVSRNGNRLVHSGASLAGGWGGEVGDWFSFVHRRRVDDRFAVFWRPWLIICVTGLVVLLVALLVFFVDPVFFAHISQDGWRSDGFFELVTHLGESGWILYSTGIALIAYSLFRPSGLVARSRHLAHTLMLSVYFVFTTIAFSGLLNLLLKNIFGRARPEFVKLPGIWDSSPFTDPYEFASFPSGHATTAGALAIALALLFPRMRIYFLLIGALIAISRPAIGVHFPSDVLAGFCFGGAFSYLYARSFARKRLLFAFDETGHLVPRFRLPRRAPVPDVR